MSRRLLIGGVAALGIGSLLGFGGCLMTLPSAVASIEAPPVPRSEMEAIRASLEPGSPRCPLIVTGGRPPVSLRCNSNIRPSIR